MSRPIAFLLTVLTLLILLIGALAIFPMIWLRPALQANLAANDFQLLAMESVSLGLESSTVEALTVESSFATFLIRGAEIHYSTAQLLAGEVEGVEITSLEIRLKEPAPDSNVDGEPVSVPQLINTLNGLPLNSVDVSEILLTTVQGQLTANLTFQTEPLFASMTGQWSAESMSDDLAILLQSEVPNENQLVFTLNAGDTDGNLVEATSEVLLFDPGMEVSGSLTVDAQSLLSYFVGGDSGQRRNWALLNDFLQLDYRVELNTQSSTPSVQLLQASVDTADSSLQIQFGTGGSEGTVQLGMPITLTASPDRANGSFLVQLTDTSGELAWQQGEDAINAEAFFGSIQSRCESWRNCLTRGKFGLSLPDWQFAGVSSESLRLSGGMRIEYGSGITELNGEDVTLTIESGGFDQWRSSGEFDVERLFLVLDTATRGGIHLRSNSLSIGSELFSLNTPALAGSLDFADGALAAVFDLAVGQEADTEAPLLRGVVNHSLEEKSGRLELTLQETAFTESRPASGLFTQSSINLDVIAGTMAGSATMSWLESNDEWQVSGPVSLRLDELSGHVEDTLLVGFSTEALGAMQGWTQLSSEAGLMARIDVVDIGLPIRNVQWQYSFDTARQELRVRELNSELFGGKVEIADFRLEPGNLDQDLTVVLSRLNLETIVGLAGYPQLLVDGLISGYIPLTLNSGQILVNDGLVGALNPGGTIRYTPASTANAINPSVQLLNDALSNYQYETLDTRVFYDDKGDLRMEVQLRGVNPDMNGGQPINLNVNVTDNIPSLLRSLKAGQQVSERLEQRIQNRR